MALMTASPAAASRSLRRLCALFTASTNVETFVDAFDNAHMRPNDLEGEAAHLVQVLCHCRGRR